MQIVAEYTDGFTAHLLQWKFISNDGAGFLTASWFRCKESLRVEFQFDESPFKDAIATLSVLATEYEEPMTDLATHSLSVSDSTSTVSRQVYGAHLLARKHPEVKAFLQLWQTLEVAITAHLPTQFP